MLPTNETLLIDCSMHYALYLVFCIQDIMVHQQFSNIGVPKQNSSMKWSVPILHDKNMWD